MGLSSLQNQIKSENIIIEKQTFEEEEAYRRDAFYNAKALTNMSTQEITSLVNSPIQKKYLSY